MSAISRLLLCTWVASSMAWATDSVTDNNASIAAIVKAQAASQKASATSNTANNVSDDDTPVTKPKVKAKAKVVKVHTARVVAVKATAATRVVAAVPDASTPPAVVSADTVVPAAPVPPVPAVKAPPVNYSVAYPHTANDLWASLMQVIGLREKGQLTRANVEKTLNAQLVDDLSQGSLVSIPGRTWYFALDLFEKTSLHFSWARKAYAEPPQGMCISFSTVDPALIAAKVVAPVAVIPPPTTAPASGVAATAPDTTTASSPMPTSEIPQSVAAAVIPYTPPKSVPPIKNYDLGNKWRASVTYNPATQCMTALDLFRGS